MTRYIIKIVEVGQERRLVGGRWELGAGKAPEEYGHTPEIEVTRDYERDVYTQLVDELDMKAVIAAVNP